MNSDTPETDAASIPTAKWKETPVCGSFARKLERERDEARKELAHQIDLACSEKVFLERERDQLRKVCDWLAKYVEGTTEIESGYNQLPHVKDKTK